MKENIIEFKNYIIENDLISPNEKVLVALSGGVDSVVLLHMICQLREELSLGVEAFHLNHGLRTEAIDDENYCKTLCDKLGVKLYVFYRDINLIAEEKAISTEEAGRTIRYELIEELIYTKGINKALTAHHMDDNAETVLMRIIRGTGLNGLEGIPIRRDYIVRPLLYMTRSEIEQYAELNELSYVTDMSNYSSEYFRNRIRNEIMPALKEENGKISQSIFRLSQIASLANDYIEKSAEKIEIASENWEESCEVAVSDIEDLHEVVLMQVFINMAQKLGVTKDLSFELINNLSSLVAERENTTWDISAPRLIFKRRYAKLIAMKDSVKIQQDSFSYQIGSSGTYFFPKEKFIVKTYIENNYKINEYNRFKKAVDYDKIRNNIILRSRVSKDSFSPVGLNGSKSIKKYFIDKKIPKEMRNSIPLLCDGDDIMCVMLYDTDERYKITEDTKNILVVELRYMEENTNL